MGIFKMNRDCRIIEGQNLLLRRVELSDVNETYCKWMNDRDLNQYMETRFIYHSHEDIKAYVKKMNDDPHIHFMAIMYKAKNQHIGNIKLGPVVKEHSRAEISLWIGEKSLWGRNLGTEAISLMRDFGCHALKLHKITAGCYSNNEASARSFEKAGFFREAVLKDEYICEGAYVDRFCYAFINMN